ncbi:hypothetical protein RDWZM_002445 [Blomia tropicalis]|uniref:Mediator of RNA polymerase II transcription subunit 11 n=1 Tax=Blomia tropicalis TaxID=40697 RepID=A0A9Q0RRR1_BLOTA|nr:Mediator of RNA polymerase II transcription subunit 11 [Blomia tropicalis]KAJ6223900.1 hypothetical protein RDWZM_002445 [Blomia tropicalis]
MESSNSNERMRILDQIESNVYQIMTFATQALNEFGKDKPSIKNVESQVNQFLKSLENVETSVSKQLQYLSKVSTLHPHEGSCYASNKVKQMSNQRLELVRSRLNELEHIKIQHQMQIQKFQNSRAQKMDVQDEATNMKPQQQQQSSVQVKSETN